MAATLAYMVIRTCPSEYKPAATIGCFSSPLHCELCNSLAHAFPTLNRYFMPSLSLSFCTLGIFDYLHHCNPWPRMESNNLLPPPQPLASSSRTNCNSHSPLTPLLNHMNCKDFTLLMLANRLKRSSSVSRTSLPSNTTPCGINPLQPLNMSLPT